MRITRFTSTSFRRRASLPVPSLSVPRGFTIAELLAVVTIIAVLVSLLCAALNSTKSKALRITCLDNMRQLQSAWQMYAEENSDSLPLNQTAPVPNKRGIRANRLSEDSWVIGNPLYDVTTANIEHGSLFQYVGSASVYRCPMDDSTVSAHPDLLRTRSYSMDAYLGGDSELVHPPKMKLTELANQSANVFVFIEEDANPGFAQSSFLVVPKAIPTVAGNWVSVPADRHSQGCNITFADGHIEYCRWYAQARSAAIGGSHVSATDLREDPDLHRLQAWIPQ
jgi:prepilin-type N-terminal cleavage/methylation domain-containing protein/prepilin-type processing-associated H-X9-DG protein